MWPIDEAGAGKTSAAPPGGKKPPVHRSMSKGPLLLLTVATRFSSADTFPRTAPLNSTFFAAMRVRGWLCSYTAIGIAIRSVCDAELYISLHQLCFVICQGSGVPFAQHSK